MVAAAAAQLLVCGRVCVVRGGMSHCGRECDGTHADCTHVAKVARRARLLPLDAALERTFDPYGFIRDAYLQRRRFLVYDGNPPEEPLEDPLEEEFDDEPDQPD